MPLSQRSPSTANTASAVSQQTQRCAKSKHKGAVSVELAIVLPLLLFVVISCFDIVRVLLIRVSIDNALAESSRQIKLTAASASNFQQMMLHTLKRKQVARFNMPNLTVSKIQFFASPTDLANGLSQSAQGSLVAPLVSYHLQYQFSALSPWLGKITFDTHTVVKHEA